MKINEKTKIAKLIKENPEALHTIVSLSPDFKRLLNPVLRRVVAGRTSIAMASKMGKVTPQDFFNALEPLGFEIEKNGGVQESKTPESNPTPPYLKTLDKEKIICFDVRKMIEEGGDPLMEIQQKVKSLNSGEALLIIADFEPVPLVKLLERQGFQSHMNFVDEKTIETYFYKTDSTATKTNLKVEKDVSTSDDWETVLKKFENQLVEIDVRHLEMPGPMMTILETLETLPEDKALFVNHKKIPVFLLSELNDRNFDYRIKDIQEGEVYLLVFKNK